MGPSISKGTGKRPLTTRAHRSEEEKENICPGSTRPQTDLEALSPGSGMAELERGAGRTKGKPLEWIWPETDVS
jgi:hypothetical protein